MVKMVKPTINGWMFECWFFFLTKQNEPLNARTFQKFQPKNPSFNEQWNFHQISPQISPPSETPVRTQQKTEARKHEWYRCIALWLGAPFANKKSATFGLLLDGEDVVVAREKNFQPTTFPLWESHKTHKKTVENPATFRS